MDNILKGGCLSELISSSMWNPAFDPDFKCTDLGLMEPYIFYKYILLWADMFCVLYIRIIKSYGSVFICLNIHKKRIQDNS